MKLKRIYQYVSRELPLWFIGLLTNWMPDTPLTCFLRGFFSRLFFKKCGRNFQYGARVRFLAPHGIEIGDNVYIAAGCWLGGSGQLVVEDEVVIGPYTIIATAIHKFKNGSVRFGGSVRAPVKIGRGTWIASHVVVTSGATIGEGNLVCAGAVVTKSMPDNVMVGGVPAGIIKERKDDDKSDDNSLSNK